MISRGITFTPLAVDELTGPRGAGYRRMIEVVTGRARRHTGRGRYRPPPLMGAEGASSTGSGFLMDGGVMAAHRRTRREMMESAVTVSGGTTGSKSPNRAHMVTLAGLADP